jgi:predicted metal-dependent HD superfamily phosphohydrolase
MLKQTYIELVSKYTDNLSLINELWLEIEKNYTSKNRYYHTLHHLENLFLQLSEVKNELENWDTILFTLFYHDVIYNALKSNNEEKSADFAEKHLQQIDIPKVIIKHCKEQILATKSHIQSSDNDTNYFTDADLSILGQPWEVYTVYYKNVRKEYSFYPDLVYNVGRKKVLKHFLSMDNIYKTDFFYTQFEIQAKENLNKELELL